MLQYVALSQAEASSDPRGPVSSQKTIVVFLGSIVLYPKRH